MAARKMFKNIGIWIDHREAVLVSVEGKGAKVEHIESHADSHFHPSGGWGTSGTCAGQSVSKEATEEARRLQQYHHFYEEVIAKTGRLASVYIFGPGKAKLELKREIEHVKELPVKIVGVDTADHLSENQIVAKVKSVFHAV